MASDDEHVTTPWKGLERRAYPRLGVAFELVLAIEVGLGGSTNAAGVTVNISRSGMLAAIDYRLPLRAHCSIRFLDADGRVEPAETAGLVRRVKPRKNDYLVGVEFDEPLERLEVELTLWKKARLFGGRKRR